MEYLLIQKTKIEKQISKIKYKKWINKQYEKSD